MIHERQHPMTPPPAEIVAALRGESKDWGDGMATVGTDLLITAADLIETLSADRDGLAWMVLVKDEALRAVNTGIEQIHDDWLEPESWNSAGCGQAAAACVNISFGIDAALAAPIPPAPLRPMSQALNKSMSIFDPEKIARVKAITDAMPAWKKGSPVNERTLKTTDKPWTYAARLSGSENHRGYTIRNAHGVLLAEVMPLDEDGERGEAVAKFLTCAANSHTQLLKALEYMEQNLVKSDYSGHCIHCGGVTQCKPSCPLFHMKAAIQAAEEAK